MVISYNFDYLAFNTHFLIGTPMDKFKVGDRIEHNFKQNPPHTNVGTIIGLYEDQYKVRFDCNCERIVDKSRLKLLEGIINIDKILSDVLGDI